MNRLQKKCLIATTGFHLLLVLILVFGSAFFVTHSKPDETQVLDVIPANLVEATFSSGVKNAQPPPPTPPAPLPPVQQIIQPPTPLPPPPKPVVTPEPRPQPRPEPIKQPEPEPVKPKPVPDEVKTPEPEPKPVKPRHEIKPVLTPVTRNAPSAADTRAAEAAREAKQAREARLKAIANVTRSIKENTSSATDVEMPGTGSVSYANYASAVKSIYERAWTPPVDTSNDDANTKVKIVVSSDGRVISSSIIDPSGESRVDASVQRTLDRVTFIAPFPDGAKEKTKTFIINFNLKAKRMLG